MGNSKSTFEFYKSKFENNLPSCKSLQETFKKTNDEIGFAPYATYGSFANVRSRKKKK